MCVSGLHNGGAGGRATAGQQTTACRAAFLLCLLSGCLVLGCAVTKPQVASCQQQCADANKGVTPSATAAASPVDTSVCAAAFTEPAPSSPTPETVPPPPADRRAFSHQLLQIPGDLPGSEAPPIRLPAFNPSQPQPDRLAEIERLFRALPESPATMQPVEGACTFDVGRVAGQGVAGEPLGTSGDGRRASGPRSRDSSRRVS